jgi:hypothetical protein
MNEKLIEMEFLKGKIIKEIVIDKWNNDKIYFIADNDEVIKMFHEYDCCESVEIEEIIGDLKDLINSPILMSECETNYSKNSGESKTWTFYKLATIKGYVTIRWCGESNGYYSEEVDLKLLDYLPDLTNTSIYDRIVL